MMKKMVKKEEKKQVKENKDLKTEMDWWNENGLKTIEVEQNWAHDRVRKKCNFRYTFELKKDDDDEEKDG